MHSNMYIRMYVLAHLHKFMFTVLVTLYAEQHIRVKNSKKVKHFFFKARFELSLKIQLRRQPAASRRELFCQVC